MMKVKQIRSERIFFAYFSFFFLLFHEVKHMMGEKERRKSIKEITCNMCVRQATNDKKLLEEAIDVVYC